MKKEIEVLREFLNMSIFSTDEVFEKFKTDSDGDMYEINGNKFYFKMGTRKDKILLVAHADTIWDKRYGEFDLGTNLKTKEPKLKHNEQLSLLEDNKTFFSGNKEFGIGADDRAGAAILWLLKDSGNSILITDKEEIGGQSSRSIIHNEEFREIVNSHRFMLQFDLHGKNSYKCYDAGSFDFKVMMDYQTKYRMLPNYSFTDIAILGKDICGANLSVGYKFEHTPYECINKKDWFNTYKMARKLCRLKHQQFYVDPDFGFMSTRGERIFDLREEDVDLIGYMDSFNDINNHELKASSNKKTEKDEEIIDFEIGPEL